MAPRSRRRRRAVWVGLALALLVAASCGDDGDAGGGGDPTDLTDPTTRSSTVTEQSGTPAPATVTAAGEGDLAGVTLTAELAVDGDVLRVAYALANDGDGALAVADAVPVQAGASFRPDPAGAWVTAATDGVVTVGRWGIRRPPEGGDRAESLSLYLVRVEAGMSVEGTIELDWPLRGRHPYLAPADLPVPLPDLVDAVRLCLGAAPLTPALDGAPVVHDDGATWLAVPMDDLTGTVCTAPVALGG